jgi:hypothetical protein
MMKGERTFTAKLVEGDGDKYLVLIEREVVGRINTWPGKPDRKKWHEERVTITLPELEMLAKRYLGGAK